MEEVSSWEHQVIKRTLEDPTDPRNVLVLPIDYLRYLWFNNR